MDKKKQYKISIIIILSIALLLLFFSVDIKYQHNYPGEHSQESIVINQILNIQQSTNLQQKKDSKLKLSRLLPLFTLHPKVKLINGERLDKDYSFVTHVPIEDHRKKITNLLTMYFQGSRYKKYHLIIC